MHVFPLTIAHGQLLLRVNPQVKQKKDFLDRKRSKSPTLNMISGQDCKCLWEPQLCLSLMYHLCVCRRVCAAGLAFYQPGNWPCDSAQE